jgi:nucleotide-binding universal stress UspA family protein
MYEKILVPLDGSELAESALPYAQELATKCGAAIVLLHVCGSSDSALRNTHKAYIDHHAEALQNDPRVAEAESVAVSSVMVAGDPATEILGYAELNNVGLIVMTTHGRSGITRWLRGSVADRVARHSPVPVQLVRSEVAAEDGRRPEAERAIVVLLDGSETAEQVLPHAVCHSKALGAQVTLLRVCEAGFITSDYPEGPDKPSWEEHVQLMRARQHELCADYIENVRRQLEGHPRCCGAGRGDRWLPRAQPGRSPGDDDARQLRRGPLVDGQCRGQAATRSLRPSPAC